MEYYEGGNLHSLVHNPDQLEQREYIFPEQYLGGEFGPRAVDI